MTGAEGTGLEDSQILELIQRKVFSYFARETNLATELVADTTSAHAPSSIAAVGLGLTAYPVAGMRGVRLSHVCIDFRGIRDACMRGHDCDCFENSRRATICGTSAPWAAAASLPFVPGIVPPTIANLCQLHLGGARRYGCKTTFNPTFPDPGGSPHGWIMPWRCGLNQGAMIAMIENYRSGLVWRLLCGCRSAGFAAGWLAPSQSPPDAGSR
jgi:hypothetical protein